MTLLVTLRRPIVCQRSATTLMRIHFPSIFFWLFFFSIPPIPATEIIPQRSGMFRAHFSFHHHLLPYVALSVFDSPFSIEEVDRITQRVLAEMRVTHRHLDV